MRRLVFLILMSCTAPDDLTVGGGWRDEELSWNGGANGVTDYVGPSLAVSATWHLKPREVVLNLSHDTKLFMQGDRPAQPVSVHVEKQTDDQKGVVESTVGALERAGKDKDGNWTGMGVLALLILAALVAGILFYLNRKPKP